MPEGQCPAPEGAILPWCQVPQAARAGRGLSAHGEDGGCSQNTLLVPKYSVSPKTLCQSQNTVSVLADAVLVAGDMSPQSPGLGAGTYFICLRFPKKSLSFGMEFSCPSKPGLLWVWGALGMWEGER